MVNLRDFLARYAERPFEWGRDDCSLILADWFEANRGVDPAAKIRATYHDEQTCHEILNKEGGLVELASKFARAMGLAHAAPIMPGDVGVIQVGPYIVGGISAGDYWAIRNKTGIGFIKKPTVLKAWRI